MSTEDTLLTPDELTILKQRATLMGISFSNNIGVDALRKKIEEKMSSDPQAPSTSGKPTQNERNRLRKEATKLIRCRIQNLDPKKKDLPGEVITVANDMIGTVRKFIPYTPEGSADGYHIPQCILNYMKEKTFMSVSRKKIPGGQVHTEARDVPEFNIVILPPLTKEELSELAKAQLAAGTGSVGH